MDEREEIRSRLDVAEVIASYIQTKPAGRSFKAICPFHSEKTPSLMINPEKGIWHCFGCHKGGDIFSFVMEIEGITFPEALQKLADKAGVTLPERSNKKSVQTKTRQRSILEAATKYFQAALASPAGKTAQTYLKQRQVSPATIKQFQIGVSPTAWDALSQFLLKKGFQEREIIESGVGIRGKKGLIDRFRARLIFPIRNASGQVVGFGGRLLKADQTGAKYLNSPESPLYHKSDTIYGFDVARDAIRKAERVVIVEGYFDVILSHQAGIQNVVASSGTALTLQQLRRLSRLTKTLVLAFDPDDAGREATLRAIELGSELGLSIYVAETPAEQDPADLALADPATWRSLTEGGVYVMDYLFAKVLASHNIATAPGKRQAAGLLTSYISLLKDPIERAHYVRELARQLNIGEQDVRAALSAPPASEDRPEASISAEDPTGPATEMRLLGLMLPNPELAPQIFAGLPREAFTDPRYRDLYNELQAMYNTGSHNFSAVPDALSSHLQPIAHFLLLSTDFAETTERPAAEAEVLFCVKRMRDDYFQRLQQRLEQALRQAEGKQDKARQHIILDKLNRVLTERKKPFALAKQAKHN